MPDGWKTGPATPTRTRFSARILKAQGSGRVIFVTGSGHEWRASHEFEGAGLAVVAARLGVSDPRESFIEENPP